MSPHVPPVPVVRVVTAEHVVLLEPGDVAMVRTYSGSSYTVARDAREGRYWFGGENVASPTSTALPPGAAYEVIAPSIVVGLPAIILAPPELDRGDPRRVPGGGKRTSPVIEVIIHRGALRATPATGSDA